MKGIYTTASGNPDPTAGKAISETDKQPKEVSQAVKYLKDIASKMGFEITNRIHLKDKETGREWK